MSIRYLTSGESHGITLTGILEGMPAGLELSEEYINFQLKRRQQGYGRGGRMKIEADRAMILSGVRFGKTLGSPISFVIENKDWKNWKNEMSIFTTDSDVGKVTIPRPGHADFAGTIKYRHDDIRNVLERSSARETAIRVAVGSVVRRLLEEFGIFIVSHIVQLKTIKSKFDLSTIHLKDINIHADKSPIRCLDRKAESQMMKIIDNAMANGDSVGGVAEIIAGEIPIGLGSHVHWDRRLDGQIAQAMMSIPAIKGVEIGAGFEAATLLGSDMHDEIFYNEEQKDNRKMGFYRKTNNAGGIEGGITNGEPIVVRIAMKPIPTLTVPLSSVDIFSKNPEKAHKERTDTCALPSAAVIAESVLVLVIANAFLEKFGGDSIDEIKTYFLKNK
ncbi:chorismate synthase [candidate division KSB1 bacterium]